MARVHRQTVNVFWLLVFVLTADVAQCAAPPAQPSTKLWIETIVVDGLTYASSALIVAEARLVGEQSYSESALRDAVHRVRRLPFVRDAEFELRRGSARGRYELVIAVDETNRVFLGEDAVVTRANPDLALGGGRPKAQSVSSAPQVGGRLFLGPYDVVFGAIGGGTGVRVGYQRYNFLGRGGVFGVAVQRAECCSNQIHDLGLDPTFSVWRDEGETHQLDLNVGVPLRGSQSLELRYSHRRSDKGTRRAGLLDAEALELGQYAQFAYKDLRRHRLEIAWRRDTTDDPMFPRQGAVVRAGFDASFFAADQRAGLATLDGVALMTDGVLPTTHTRQIRLLLAAEKTWSAGRRHAVSFGVHGAAGRAQLENLPVDVQRIDGVPMPIVASENPDVWAAGLSARYTVSVFSASQARRFGELYWQNRLSVDFEEADVAFPSAHGSRLEVIKLETSIALRSTWGLFRLTFQLLELSS